MKPQKLFLSRRNLLTLLSKLDRAKRGEETAGTIIKYRNPVGDHVQTMDECSVIAVEDSDYYTYRGPGPVHPADNPQKEARE
jgi:hypothetical protein